MKNKFNENYIFIFKIPATDGASRKINGATIVGVSPGDFIFMSRARANFNRTNYKLYLKMK